METLDITFRRLLRKLPRPILQLAFPDHQLKPFSPPADPSLDRSQRRTGDNLFWVREGRRKVVVHFEIEREWRNHMPRRLFEYASAAVMETALPVSSIVILLKPGGRPPADIGIHRIAGVSGDTFMFHYHVVPLWRLDARRMRVQLGLAGAPFCVAMRGADEDFVEELAREVRADPGMSEQERATLVKLLYFVTAVMLGSETARRIFHMESIIQDPSIQELVREWEDKGRVEGRVEGRAEEARALLLKVLALRALPVTPDVRARIEGEPDVARLEAWLEAAVTASAIGDVFRDS